MPIGEITSKQAEEWEKELQYAKYTGRGDQTKLETNLQNYANKHPTNTYWQQYMSDEELKAHKAKELRAKKEADFLKNLAAKRAQAAEAKKEADFLQDAAVRRAQAKRSAWTKDRKPNNRVREEGGNAMTASFAMRRNNETVAAGRATEQNVRGPRTGPRRSSRSGSGSRWRWQRLAPEPASLHISFT